MHEVPEETMECFKDLLLAMNIVQGTARFVSDPPLSASIHFVLAWHSDAEEGVQHVTG